MQQDHNISADDHDELVNLIPWYVKGKLSEGENAVVKQHLDTCESCRLEASNSTALAAELAMPKESWRPSAAHFASIMAEVDKLEAAEKPKQASNTVTKAGFFQRLQLVFAQTPRPVRWTLAVESLVFAVLAAVMVLPGVIHINKAQPSAFETLSNLETPPAQSGQMLRVVFADDITAKELSDLLLQTKAQIRQGPSTVGAYTVETAVGDADKVQVTLRAHPKVKLVLPATTPQP